MSQAPAIADRTLFRRSLAFVKPHLRLVFLGLFLLPMVAVSKLITPYLLKVAIDGPIRKGELSGITTIAVVYLLVVLLQGVLNLARQYVMQMLGQRIITDLRTSLFEAVTRLSMRYFDVNPIGKIINRMTHDIDSLNEFLSSGLVDIVSDGLMLIGIVIIMFALDAELALYSLALMPVLVIFVGLARKLMRGIYSRLSVKNARCLAYSQEALSGLMVLQAFRREQASSKHYQGLLDDALEENLRGVWWSSQVSAVVELASYLSIGLLLLLGPSETTSLGVLVAFIEYIQLFYRPVEGLSGRFAVLQKALASSEKIFQLFDDADQHGDPEGEVEAPELSEGIRFRDVDFSYVPSAPVLRGFNLEIKKGETLALVGATGAGKSSLIKLLSRFYQPQSGTIEWDGQDLQSFSRKSLRRRLGYVPQETFLFSDTLGGNISLGRGDVNQAVEAARAVQADRVADDLPRGFDEMIGEEGRNLSAGERQLIAFARAVAQDPDLLILDEATANIDGATEEVIQQALQRLLEGRTAIVIAHRLSTIREADKIAVIHKGQLRELGNHDELIAKKGLYYTLYRLQGGADEAEDGA